MNSKRTSNELIYYKIEANFHMILEFKILLISALTTVSLYTSVVYAADNVALSYNVIPNQVLTINLTGKVGKINS